MEDFRSDIATHHIVEMGMHLAEAYGRDAGLKYLLHFRIPTKVVVRVLCEPCCRRGARRGRPVDLSLLDEPAFVVFATWLHGVFRHPRPPLRPC